jgi:hypothetical protein
LSARGPEGNPSKTKPYCYNIRVKMPGCKKPDTEIRMQDMAMRGEFMKMASCITSNVL